MRTNTDDDDRTKRQFVPDGKVVRVPLFLMDGKSVNISDVIRDAYEPKAPVITRTLPMSDSDRTRREQMLADRDARLSNAWKEPNPAPVVQKQADKVPATGDPYAARDARLTNRWRDAS